MKIFKKLLAVALAGVLALSVLTGCGSDSKSMLSALNSIAKSDGITFKSGADEKAKAQAAAKTLTGATLLDHDESSFLKRAELNDALAAIHVTLDRNQSNPYITDGSCVLWMVCMKTKNMDATAQAYTIYSCWGIANPAGIIEDSQRSFVLKALPTSGDPESSTLHIGTANFKNAKGEDYCLAIITRDAA